MAEQKIVILTRELSLTEHVKDIEDEGATGGDQEGAAASQLDWASYEKEGIVPASTLSKKKLKSMKLQARGERYLGVCLLCCSGMGTDKSIETHIAGRAHKLAIKQRDLDEVLASPPALTPGGLAGLSQSLEQRFLASRGEPGVGEAILRQLAGLCDVRLCLHGSRASSFSLANSNVNISLELPSDSSSLETAAAFKDFVAILEANDSLYSDVVADFQSFNKIPRVLFRHKASQLGCEARASAGNPVALAKLLRCYGDADERAHKLGVLFSHWAKVCGLDVQEEGYYPAHMFVVMVIHFLQQTAPPVLPVLHQALQPGQPAADTDGLLTEEQLDSFRASASDWSSANTQSLGELWLALLRYYSWELDNSKMAASLRQVEPVSRESCQWGTHRLAVEDPMMPKNNLAKAGFYDKVFDYYLSSIKATAVLFLQEAGSPNLSLDNCTIQSRPSACVSCKQVKHVFKNCPTECLPVLEKLRTPTPSRESLSKMSRAFKNYMKEVAPDAEELRYRESACQHVLRDISRVAPGAQLKLFGSSVNGFGTMSSDMDMCLILPATEQSQTREDQVILVEEMAKQLRRAPGYDALVSITSARVPIVKFTLRHYDNIDCDVSLENRLAIRNTALLKHYSVIDSRARVLGYAVKAFAKSCDIGDASAGSLSSYAYILLMIHFLQQTTPPVLPVLQQLGGGKGPIIDQWDCYFYEFTSPDQLRGAWPVGGANNKSVSQLWLEFLTYCLTFDWRNNVVTINQLAPRSKVDKWWFKHMCIEDPFNLDHNLGSNVGPKMRGYILDRFKAALVHHSSPLNWRDMTQLMSVSALVGDSKAPKFLTCFLCNARGHRAQQCTVKPENYRRTAAPVRRAHHQPPAGPPAKKGHKPPAGRGRGVPQPPAARQDMRPLLATPEGVRLGPGVSRGQPRQQEQWAQQTRVTTINYRPAQQPQRVPPTGQRAPPTERGPPFRAGVPYSARPVQYASYDSHVRAPLYPTSHMTFAPPPPQNPRRQ